MNDAVEFKGITKDFPGVRALEDVSFGVREGEIHALMGENGAGKSTLLRILGGDHHPDAGEVSVGGAAVHMQSPHDALSLGIRVIYQEPNLVPGVTVAENLFVGRLPRRGLRMDRRRLHAMAEKEIERLGASFAPDDLIVDLSTAQRQLVEIGKALAADARVLALDEPSSSLSAREVEHLFDVLRRLRDDGVAVIYVSHRLAEVLVLSERITVLRDGRHVGTVDTASTSERALIRMMVGRDLGSMFKRSERQLGAPLLELRGLTTERIRDVSFSVRTSEVVGIAGLMGSGRSAVARAIFGLEPISGGSLLVDGREVDVRAPRDAIRAGIALCPEDRKRDALILQRSVAENIALSSQDRLAHLSVIDRRREAELVDGYVQDLRIKTPGRDVLAVSLSGGNQQKIVLARALAMRPRILILDEPTRGIDIGAKSEIYALVEALASQGMAVVLISSELIEVLGLADRIVVMRDGQKTGELPGATASEEGILTLAMVPEMTAEPAGAAA
jgi:L-arabinose transport system ATP-binding protein